MVRPGNRRLRVAGVLQQKEERKKGLHPTSRPRGWEGVQSLLDGSSGTVILRAEPGFCYKGPLGNSVNRLRVWGMINRNRKVECET